MPYSDDSNIKYVKEYIEVIRPRTTLDIGPGAGKYCRIIKAYVPGAKVFGVEAWEPYIEEFNLRSFYDDVYVKDVRDWSDYNYDLVIFGDVLEHMTKEDAIEVWGKAINKANNVLLSIPTVHYPQGHEHGNPYEEHIKDDWSVKEVLDTFECIYDWETYESTTTFLAGC